MTQPAVRQSSRARACAALRERSLAVEEGSFLGAEDVLHASFGVSQSTIRQAARIVETEGLLMVRRGMGGGYFAARPKIEIIEAAVSAYLVSRSVASEDALVVSGLIWPEAVRRAAAARPAMDHIRKIERTIDRANARMSLDEFRAAEKKVTHLIMQLANSDYIQFILDLNLTFFKLRGAGGELPVTEEFLAGWKAAHMMEVAAIKAGDEELAVFAGRRFREFLQKWVRATSQNGKGRSAV